MSEILEKLLLVSFGLMTLFLILPIFGPLLENSMENYQEREREVSIIDSDMENLRDMIDFYYNLNSVENYTQNFEFQGKISCVIFNMVLNSTNYRFNFYTEITNSPIYRDLEIDIKFNVSVRTLFISQFLLKSENNSKFLFFF